MSGGSHNYLHHQEALQPSDLDSVANRLEELGFKDATRVFISPALEHPIREVWKAIDRLDSNDWGPDQVTEAVEQWREDK